MNTHLFELAPASRLHEWDKALAFAIATGAPAFGAAYFLGDKSILLASIVSAVCFLGTFVVALTLTSRSAGRVALTRDALLLDSGFLHARVPLAELDLAAARPGADAAAGLRLDTRAANAVTIPRRDGPAVVITPLDREGFLQTLRSLRA